MVKRILLTLLQFIAFLVLLAVGGYWDVVHLLLKMKAPALSFIPLLRINVSANHVLIADGLLFAGILYLLILLIEALRKALHPWAALTTLALVLALMLSFAMKIGLPPSHSDESQGVRASAQVAV
jgi:hypothetical protein